MNIDFKSMMKKPKEVGTEIWVLDGHGKLVGRYDTVLLAKDWLAMNNDEFYKLYGFSWVPPSKIQKQARLLLQ